MADTFISADFLGSSTSERVAMCRKLGAEAARRADEAANPETMRAYLDLKRQWETLAAELESTDSLSADNKRS